MKSQDALVEHLTKIGVLRTQNIIQAFQAVDRKDFVLPEWRSDAYEDFPLPIGYGQTISQPYTVAFMLELLQPQPGETILDVGSGSGWTTVLLARCSTALGGQGSVYGVEIVPELVVFGQQNLEKYKFSRARIFQAGKKLGLPEQAPFDKILVSAAAQEVPQELLAQLKIGGILVVPVQSNVLRVRKISETKTDIQTFESFAFVPLIK